MEVPSIKSKLPDALEFKDIILKPPTADMPVFPPIVIPPGNIKAPAGVELEEPPAETEDEETTSMVQPTLKIPVVKIDLPLPSAEVVATATYAAVAAVATTTLATPLFDTGALATFGLTTGNNNKNKGPVNCPMAKKKEE
jgi:hypothetical protein